MDRLWVSTRKGLFRLDRSASGAWDIAHVAFLGDSVSLALPDRRDGAVYAGLGLGHFGVKLRRSRDAGLTWEELAAPAFPAQPEGEADTLPDGRPWPWRVEQIWSLEAGHEAGMLWCGTIGGGLFRSDDAGSSWSLVRSLWDHPKRKGWFGGGADLPGIHSVCVHPEEPRRVLVGISCGGVWQSRDAGETWELSADGMFASYMPPGLERDPNTQDPHRVVQCPSAPERLWAQHHNGVFRSDDGGRSWHSIDNVPPSTFGFAVAVHPREPDSAWFVPAVLDQQRVPVAGNVVVARTRDAGKSWDTLTQGLPQGHAYDLVYRHALDIDESGERLALGSTTGSLWLTENGGDSFQELSAHLPPIYAVRFG
jgi:photosystem II stability/assembly factor-like uncharacterized protein